MELVKAKPLTAVQRSFRNRLHSATQLSFHLRLVQDIAAEGGIFKTKIPGLSEDRQNIVFLPLAVFVLATRAAHKNQHSDNFYVKLHVAYLSLWNGEQSNAGLCGNYFKISGVLWQQRKTITTRVVWEKYLGMLLSTDADTQL